MEEKQECSKSISKITSKSNISSSNKSTNVTLLGNEMGQPLKNLLVTNVSPTGVEIEKGLSKTLGTISNFIDTKGVTKDKVAP